MSLWKLVDKYTVIIRWRLLPSTLHLYCFENNDIGSVGLRSFVAFCPLDVVFKRYDRETAVELTIVFSVSIYMCCRYDIINYI